MMTAKEKETYIVELYKEGDSSAKVEVLKVTDSLLKQVIKDCASLRYIEERIFSYEEYGTDIEWIDMEGEGYGWLWQNYPPRKWHFALRMNMQAYLNLMKEAIKKEESFVVVSKSEEEIKYFFLGSEDDLEDTQYTFSRKPIDFM